MPFFIVEFADLNEFLEPVADILLSKGIAEKIRDRPSHDLVAAISHLLQPVIGHCHDAAVCVHGMQHCRRRAVEVPVFEVGLGLIRRLGIYRNRAHEGSIRIVFDQRVGEAIDFLPGFRHKRDRLVFQLAGPAKCWNKFVLDTTDARLRYEFCRAPADHFSPCKTQPIQQRIVDIEVPAISVDQAGHGRSLAKKPVIVV